MARQTKKILKKIHPKKKKWQTETPKEKVGKDYLLIIVVSITVLFLIIGWSNFEITNRVLYVALTVALGTTYARRHYDFSEQKDKWVERTGYAAMAIATIAFVVNVYQNYFS